MENENIEYKKSLTQLKEGLISIVANNINEKKKNLSIKIEKYKYG
jgi:hypothetical protein